MWNLNNPFPQVSSVIASTRSCWRHSRSRCFSSLPHSPTDCTFLAGKHLIDKLLMKNIFPRPSPTNKTVFIASVLVSIPNLMILVSCRIRADYFTNYSDDLHVHTWRFFRCEGSDESASTWVRAWWLFGRRCVDDFLLFAKRMNSQSLNRAWLQRKMN